MQSNAIRQRGTGNEGGRRNVINSCVLAKFKVGKHLGSGEKFREVFNDSMWGGL